MNLTAIIGLTIGILIGLLIFVTMILKFKYPKTKSNPEIKKFEAHIKKRGLLLVEANYSRSSILIMNKEKFINFAKRSGVGTIFKAYRYIDEKYVYFYITDGQIIRISIKSKVKA